ncbi:MAG: hypothetical protein RIB58_06110 [Phycisphaerales bacterium]
MGEEGFVLGPDFPSETDETGWERTPERTLDPSLARVVDAWEDLSPSRRRLILGVLQWHERATAPDATPPAGAGPWVERLRKAKDLGAAGKADLALFQTTGGDYEAVSHDAMTVADLAGLELECDGEPFRAVVPQGQLPGLLERLVRAGIVVVVLEQPTEAERATGMVQRRRVCRMAYPGEQLGDGSAPDGGWSHGETPPALNLTQH